MVFKKPYAILIKHFKLIHLIMTILMAYIIYKMTGIISFFNEYVSSGWMSITESEISSYIHSLMYFSIVLILILSIIIYLLMRFKKKPRLYYLITPILYIIILIILIITSSIMHNAILDVINPITSRAIRDILLIFTALQFIIIVFSLLRAIGFDVKKFNFRQDIADLEISELDNEEVEVGFEVKKYKIKRNLKRKYRNFKYIFLEHKFIWTLVILIVILSIAGFIVYNIFVVNKSYKQNTIIPLDSYSINVTNSAVITTDYKGDEISDKYKYVIVNTTIINRISNNTFKIDNLSLEANGKIYSTINKGYSRFLDFGYGYTEGRKLSVEKNNKYIFAFRIPKDSSIGTAYLRYLYKMDYKSGKSTPQYKKIKLNYNNYEKSTTTVESKLNEVLNFNNNSIKFSSIEFNDKYTYKYNLCTSKNNCNELICYILSNNNSTVLKLNSEIKFDSDNPITKFNNLGEFFEKYASIKYKKNNKIYVQKNIKNLTPNNIDNNEIYLNVSKEIQDAQEIRLEFRHNGVNYSYIIKNK